MVERLIEYRRKCKILKQIQSNKALANKNFSFAQSLITVFVSALLTFFGFSGLDKIKLYILIVANKEVTIDSVGMFFNILVFLLFFIGIVQMIFQFNTKQTSSEKAIQQQIEQAATGRTTLIIAHRLSTIMNAHQILVMEAGRIIERGTHQELIQQHGTYAQMWVLQQQEGRQGKANTA